MRFYNIEAKGKMIVEKRTSHPSYTLADVGRIYSCGGYLYYIGDQGVGAPLLCNYLLIDKCFGDLHYAIPDSYNMWFECNVFQVPCYRAQGIVVNHSACVCGDTVSVNRGHIVWPIDGAAIAGYTTCGNALKGNSVYGTGVQALSCTCYAVYGYSTNCYGVYGYSKNCYGGYFFTDAILKSALRACSVGAFSVSGNTPYHCYSSKYIKYFEGVCLSNCVRKTPLSVYKYYWEDSNSKAFMQSIGPAAEDFDATFNVNNHPDKEDYEGLWTVDGAALGLSLENLKEIDKLKEIVVEMYSCIKKLENKET